MQDEPNKHKNWLLIGVGIFLAGSLVLIYFALTHNNQKAPTTQKPPVVTIDNTAKLGQILLTQQFLAVKKELSSYAAQHISDKITKISIVGKPVVERTGKITFSAETDNPKKQFAVTIDRTHFDKIIFSVPQDGYTNTIKIYSSQNQSGD